MTRRRALLAAAYDSGERLLLRRALAHRRAGDRSPDAGGRAPPLYFGLATPEQGRAVAARLGRDFLKPGGFVTTLRNHGQQWDAPNGWPPLQWLAIRACGVYGRDDIADRRADALARAQSPNVLR